MQHQSAAVAAAWSFGEILAGIMPQREGERDGDNVESYLQYQLFVYTWMCIYYVPAKELELCHTEDTAPYKDKLCWRIRLSAGWHYCSSDGSTQVKFRRLIFQSNLTLMTLIH